MATYLTETRFPSGNGSHFKLWMDYEISQSISGNYTDVTFHLNFQSLDGYNGNGAATNGYINGNWVGSTTSIGKNSNVWLGYRTDRYYHNADGTGSASYSASISSPWGIGTASVSGTITLPTIPRASSVTATSAEIESATSININRASSGFKHTLRYKFGSLTGTIATNVATSYGWTLPTSFYEQIPNAKTGTCTIYCDTYSGSTLLGTKSTTFTVKTNEELCKPEVSVIVEDINKKTTELTGPTNKFVKYMSNALITTTSVARNNATIKSTSVVCGDGKSGTGESVTLNKVESAKFTITVTDSRGYSTVIVSQKTLINYVNLTINPTFVRPEPTTGEVKLTYNGNYFNGSFGTTNNSLTVRYRYKETGTDTWSAYKTLTSSLSGNTYSNTVSLGTDFDYRKSYNFQIQAIDKLQTITNSEGSVSQGIPMLALFKEYIEMFGSEVFKFDDENDKLLINKDLIINGTNTSLGELAQINITPNGEPVKTGRIIDGKEEYVKMVQTTLGSYEKTNENNYQWTLSSGLSNVTVTREVESYVTTANGSVLNGNMVRFTSTTLKTNSSYTYWEGSNGSIVFITGGFDRTGSTFTTYIYFTYN